MHERLVIGTERLEQRLEILLRPSLPGLTSETKKRMIKQKTFKQEIIYGTG